MEQSSDMSPELTYLKYLGLHQEASISDSYVGVGILKIYLLTFF